LASPETGSQNRRYRDLSRRQRPHARYLNRGNARILRAILQRPGNAGSHRTAWWWMQSDANPSPHPNFLITGKNTGNFARSGSQQPFLCPIDEQIQCLAAEFPAHGNREFPDRVSGKNFQRNRRFQAPEQGIRSRPNILAIVSASSNIKDALPARRMRRAGVNWARFLCISTPKTRSGRRIFSALIPMQENMSNGD
jgi:hypothetical protein